MTTVTGCRSCGVEPLQSARFGDGCGELKARARGDTRKPAPFAQRCPQLPAALGFGADIGRAEAIS